MIKVSLAAGTICRKDELRPGRLIFGGARKAGNLPYQPGAFSDLKRIVHNNLIYIANLIALHQWYCHVRSQFISENFSEPVLAGLKEKLNWAISERINRLESFCLKKDEDSAGPPSDQADSAFPVTKQRQELLANYGQIADLLESYQKISGDVRSRDPFLETVHKGIKKSGPDYIAVIQQLSPTEGELATAWLQAIVDHIVKNALGIIPSFK